MNRRAFSLSSWALALSLLLALVLTAAQPTLSAPQDALQYPSTTTLVSVAPGGTEGNGYSEHPSISAHGRWVAFQSHATKLVAGGTTPGLIHIYLRDMQQGQTALASRGPLGVEGNDSSYNPSLSADGQHVAFESDATNLVSPGTKPGIVHTYVHDMQTRQTTLISRSPGGSQANDHSGAASISADGRYVAFMSEATNLVSGVTSGNQHVFLCDRKTGGITLVSRSAGGEQGDGESGYPSISATGRYVAYVSAATNLIPGGTGSSTQLVYLHDAQAGGTSLVSKSSSGEAANADSYHAFISGSGRYVAFHSRATNLVTGGTTTGRTHIYVHDRSTGETTLVTRNPTGLEADGNSFDPSLSADGRSVAFESVATNLIPGGSVPSTHHVYLHDHQTGETRVVSRSASGAYGDDWSDQPHISSDGRHVAFASRATNLLDPGSSGEWKQVYIAAVWGNRVYMPLVVKP